MRRLAPFPTGQICVVFFFADVCANSNGAIFQNDSNQSGFTTEISVWIPLEGDDDNNVVYVGTEIWTGDTPMTCSVPCVLVIPTSTLEAPSTLDPGLYPTSFEYGHISTVTNANGATATTFITETTTITITIPKTVVSAMSYSNVNITQGITSGGVVILPSVNLPPVDITLPDGQGGSTVRTIDLPPWPAVTNGPPDTWNNPADPFDGGDDDGTGQVGTPSPRVYRTMFTTTVSATGPTVTTLSFASTIDPITFNCPPDTTIAFNTPRTIITTECDDATVLTLGFTCPATKVVTFLAASSGVFSVDCTISTLFTAPEPTTTEPTTTTTTPLPVWATWPAGMITPVPTPVNDPEPDDPEPGDTGVKTSCKLWFFSVSVIWMGAYTRPTLLPTVW